MLSEYFLHLIYNSCRLLRDTALISQPGKVPMKPTDIQFGEFVDEGDIVMFDDVSGRK